MKIIEKENFKVVTPTENMLLCNVGEKIISDELTMPLSADVSSWEEITTEEAEALQKQWESADFSETTEATEADYQNALAEMGVDLNG